MKRALILAFLILIAAPAVFVAAGIQVDSQKEKIVITESTLYGNPQAAEGLQLKMISTAYNLAYLFWDTSYALNNGKTDSSFLFSRRAEFYRLTEAPQNDYINMSVVSLWGGEEMSFQSGSFHPDMLRLSKVVEAVAGRTEAGQQHTETVRLADYYEYYPLAFNLRSYAYDVEYYDELYYENGAEHPSQSYFTDLFQIPVNDREVWKVTLKKDEAGEVIDVQCSLLKGVMIDNFAAFGREGVYHAYRLRLATRTDYREESTEEGSLPEKEPEDNYSIYYYPYIERQGGDRNVFQFTIDPQQARMVCDLEPGIQIEDMRLSEVRDRLYLVTSEGEDIVLRVYEVEETGVSLRQKLPVCPVTAGFFRMSVQEEGILFILDGGCFALVDTSGEECKLWCLEEETVLDPIYFRYENFWDFDGERLALAAFTDDQKVSVDLAVYTEDGLVWYGICEHSGAPYTAIRGVEWEEAI